MMGKANYCNKCKTYVLDDYCYKCKCNIRAVDKFSEDSTFDMFNKMFNKKGNK